MRQRGLAKLGDITGDITIVFNTITSAVSTVTSAVSTSAVAAAGASGERFRMALSAWRAA